MDKELHLNWICQEWNFAKPFTAHVFLHASLLNGANENSNQKCILPLIYFPAWKYISYAFMEAYKEKNI